MSKRLARWGNRRARRQRLVWRASGTATSYEDVPPSGECAKCVNSKGFPKVSTCSITDRSNPPAVAATIQSPPLDIGLSYIFLLPPGPLHPRRTLAFRTEDLRAFIPSYPGFLDLTCATGAPPMQGFSNQEDRRTMPLDPHDALRNPYPEPYSVPTTVRRRPVLRPADRFAGRKRP